MIDINTIINTAISTAVNQAIQPIRAHYDAQLEALQKQITELKARPVATVDTPNIAATALHLMVTSETSPIYSAICGIAHNAAVAVAEEVMASHLEGYSHDDYDRALTTIEDANLDSLPDFDDFVKHDDLSGAIEDRLNRASISFNF